MEHITSLVRDEIIKLLSAKDIVAMSIALSTFVQCSVLNRDKHHRRFNNTLATFSSLMIFRYCWLGLKDMNKGAKYDLHFNMYAEIYDNVPYITINLHTNHIHYIHMGRCVLKRAYQDRSYVKWSPKLQNWEESVGYYDRVAHMYASGDNELIITAFDNRRKNGDENTMISASKHYYQNYPTVIVRDCSGN
jgi:hypothetical protein